MEKVEDFISKVPGIVIKMIQEQQNFEQYQNYLQKIQNDIKYFKKHKTFPKPLDGVLTENVHKNVSQIKLERISEIPHDEHDIKSCDISTSDFRKENVNPEELEMPPPQLPVKKTRKIKKEPSIANTRSTRGRASQRTQMESDNISRDSDIIVQEQPIKTITLTDSDNEDVTNIREVSKQSNFNLEHDKSHIENVPPTRSTRTKTRMKKNDVDNEKRTISSSPSPINIKSMRQMKRKMSEEQIDNNLNKTVTIQGKAVENATFAVQKEPPASIDNTVIIGGLNIVDNSLVTNLNDIMTDDEDDNITVTVPTRDTYNIKAGTRAVFNPFEESPVKKRVEAFEKLVVEDVSGIPLATTRNLAKTNAKEKEEALILTPKYLNLPREVRTTPKVANRYLATVSNSANKALKTNMMNESVRPVKAISSLKSSQFEFNERETKRREKESEAMKKRIAQMHAQTEEKKKKRLEKQIKAQQLREMQERNKLEALREAEKAKEERHKQILAEKQEKAKKLHEESERRRVEALKRAMEEKRREEERKRIVEEAQEKLKHDELRMALREERKATRVLEQKKKPRNRLPIFLREKAPLLPTEDCYDSDQEQHALDQSHSNARKATRSAWTFNQKMFPQLKKMNRIDKKIVSSFFMMTVTTPNLKDIFVNIDPLKLKRTSSAVWKAPPRYTLMPESIEENDEEDCSD